jgi:DNA-binding PadR family transcriptional regulator
MDDQKQLWPLMEEAMRAFEPFYRQVMRKAIEDSGVPDDWFALSLARGSEPAPFTVERFHALSPYTARERQAGVLERLVQLELLEPVGEEAYRLTDPGRETVEAIFGAAHQVLGAVEPLPAGEMGELNGLLRRLVEATLEAPKPEDKWAIAYSRWTDPGEDAPASVLTDQYLTDLIRFRDDAHLAAWKPYDVSGHAWEALTFIWRGQAGSAEELVEKLPYRSRTVEDYREALRDLVTRGWIVGESGTYSLTEAGTRVREDAEEATDRLFFAPWACLSASETARLRELLTRMRDELHSAAGDDVDAT